ncbi:gamma-glutamylcyclotransferase family protein [Bradyrhizobium sp. 162]|uniref:gamma-glutamylcyclotransferase family protein n=1 Tax=Bradyrhizobium sp. 162 TaxID=2782635 RepID=UPI001FFAE318|nr:gamma-glutamylcyclotransferase family protein [Bradyrhizobium sp. 162]MCK1634867.1 gamma-glutamylcyclotransferase [Bradyrhizobium sp. 162]
MTSNRLFVYGTLMRGFDHPMARLLAGHADFLVTHYPGLLLSDVPSDRAHGELFHLRVPDELLRELDMYEACGEGFPEPTEYLRQLVDVTGADGVTAPAWTYIYNWPVTDLPRIESGRFLGL